MEAPFKNGQSSPMPDSLWSATTAVLPPMPALDGDATADVVVVGAGFMGLAAALALAESGVQVVVIEAAQIGWGASGRNNGLLAAGLKRDPDEVRRLLGTGRAERLLRLSGDAPAVVRDLVQKHEIECDLNTSGWIQAAHSRAVLPLLRNRVRQWQELGADVSLIAAQDVADRLGTDYYAGAWFDPRGGSLNPLSYVRGLATAAQRAGAEIHEQTAALSINGTRSGWTVTTSSGSLRSKYVLVCTNAYNDKISQLRGRVLPLRTAQIASRPLTSEEAETILPGGESASDTQRLLTSFRLTADQRLIMGGASATAGDESPHLFEWLYRAARDRFARLGSIEWEYGWSGYLALTNDHLPQILKLGNRGYAGIGCNGRGIAIATVTGQALATLVNCGSERDSAIPIVNPRRYPGFALRHPGVAIGVTISRILDIAGRK